MATLINRKPISYSFEILQLVSTIHGAHPSEKELEDESGQYWDQIVRSHLTELVRQSPLSQPRLSSQIHPFLTSGDASKVSCQQKR